MKKSQAETTAVALAVLNPQEQVVYVRFDRLCLSPHNARRKPPTGIPELADDIEANRVLQNLVVHVMSDSSDADPVYGVCAGQRRWLALGLLHTRGRIDGGYLVPVLVRSEGEALVISLIENSEREGMHVADQCIAFDRLVGEGRTVAEIAIRAKTTEKNVQRALRLASVSPKLMEVFRDDGMKYEQVCALALTDDHELQERLWFGVANDWQRAPAQIRGAITQAEVSAEDNPLVAFVGLDDYEAAGGHVRRDLFSDGANAGYVADIELLNRLAVGKLCAVAVEVGTEGWSWVETRVERDYAELARYGRLSPEHREFTRKEKTAYRAFKKVRDAAVTALNAYYDSEEEDEDDTRRERLEDEAAKAEQDVDTCEEKLKSWTDEQKANAGVFVSLDHSGMLKIERGLVKPQEKAAVKAQGVRGADDIDVPKAKPLHNESLCLRLTAHRTAAVQAELMQQPTTALAYLMTAIIPTVFSEKFTEWYKPHALGVKATSSHDRLLRVADDMEGSTAWTFIDGEREKWRNMLPDRFDALLPWLLRQSEDVLANLFAFCVAASLDGTSATDSEHAVNTIADLLQLDMRAYWKPTCASYLDHVSKQRIVDVVSQAVSPEAAAPLASMKKAEASAAAELRLAETGWLPEVLANRTAPHDMDDDESGDIEDDEAQPDDAE